MSHEAFIENNSFLYVMIARVLRHKREEIERRMMYICNNDDHLLWLRLRKVFKSQTHIQIASDDKSIKLH